MTATVYSRICKVPDCNGIAGVPGTAHGYCVRHYWREKRTGFPECSVDGCDRFIGPFGRMGFCAMHTPEWAA